MWGISETVHAKSFQIFAIVFSTPENLLEGISGALGMNRKSLSQAKMHFEKMLWGTLEMVNAGPFTPVPLCSGPPENLTSRDFWSSRNDRKVTFSAKICCEKMLQGYLRTWCMLELSDLCHCVQHP